MNLGLKNKVAIVLGASKGLGKACAKALALEGSQVVIGSRDEKILKDTALELEKETGSKILAVSTDVTIPKDLENFVARTIKKFGRIDILVNNAGGPPAGKFESFGDRQWQSAFETNLLSAIRLTRLVIPHMRLTGSGRIINLVSVAVKQPMDNLILSNSIRAGVVGMAKTLSQELATDNITVNNIATGLFLTERIKQLYDTEEKMK
ncbi:SDR family NAD(P)-dependent oxidoreductase, partial [Patescibacteria group bacterium]|nr:SDR family NAD(P)-dependent oxidoreductase [Patescibacteria group bacterium]